MAIQISDEQRAQVRSALCEAGVHPETVDEMEDRDIHLLFLNGWKSKGFILNAQREDLLTADVSKGAVGVIMSLKHGEQSHMGPCMAWNDFMTLCF